MLKRYKITKNKKKYSEIIANNFIENYNDCDEIFMKDISILHSIR